MRETAAQVGQWLITSAYGCAAYVAVMDSPNTFERTLAALIGGFGGLWATMFLYVWARFGWRAARSLRLYGGE